MTRFINFEMFLFQNRLFIPSTIMNDIKKYRTFKYLVYHFLRTCARLQLMRGFQKTIRTDFVDDLFLNFDFYAKKLFEELGHIKKYADKKIQNLRMLYDFFYEQCEDIRTANKTLHMKEIMDYEFKELLKIEKRKKDKKQNKVKFNEEQTGEAFLKLRNQFKRNLALLYIYRKTGRIIPSDFVKKNLSNFDLFLNLLEKKDILTEVKLREEYSEIVEVLTRIIETGAWPQQYRDIGFFKDKISEVEKNVT